MATETLVLDGVVSSSGFAGGSPTVAELNTDDTTYAEPTNNNTSTDAILSFPTPSGDLTTGADLQTLTVVCRQNTTSPGTGTATAQIELYEAGGAGNPLASSSVVNITSSSGDTNVVLTFNATLLAAISGADVQVHLIGTKSGGSPTTRISVAWDYVKWDVTYDISGQSGDGAATSPSLAPAGTATRYSIGSDGTPAIPVQVPAGTATRYSSATDGAPAIPVQVPAGTATRYSSATDGTPAVAVQVPAGTASIGGSGETASDGAPAIPVQVPAGTATRYSSATDGTPAVPVKTAAGLIDITQAASDGTPAVPVQVPAATATKANPTGSDGTPAVAVPVPAGTASLPAVNQGAATIPPATAAGTAARQPVAIDGAPAIPVQVPAGTATRYSIGSDGTPAIPVQVPAGTATRYSIGSDGTPAVPVQVPAATATKANPTGSDGTPAVAVPVPAGTASHTRAAIDGAPAIPQKIAAGVAIKTARVVGVGNVPVQVAIAAGQATTAPAPQWIVETETDRRRAFLPHQVTITPGPGIIFGLYDIDEQLDEIGRVRFSSERAVVLINTTDADGIVIGTSTVVTSGGTYLVKNIEHDGTGMTTLTMVKT